MLGRDLFGTRRDSVRAGRRIGTCKPCVARLAKERANNVGFVPRKQRYDNLDGTRTCRVCEISQEMDKFPIRNKETSTRRNECCACLKKISAKRASNNLPHRRELSRRLNYGLEFGEYDRMHAEQNGLCAICHNPETTKHRSGKVRTLFVDHDHSSGAVRSLLCMRCNIGLGQFYDDTSLMRSAIDYLDKHRD